MFARCGSFILFQKMPFLIYLMYKLVIEVLKMNAVFTQSIRTDKHMQTKTRPEVMILFSCTVQLSMQFILLINLKLLAIAYSFLLDIAESENYSAYKYDNAKYAPMQYCRKGCAAAQFLYKPFQPGRPKPIPVQTV